MAKKKKNINNGKIKAQNVKIGDENHYHYYGRQKPSVGIWVVGIILLIEVVLGLWGELMPSDFQKQLEEAANGHYTVAWVGIGVMLILFLLILTFWRRAPNELEVPTSLSAEMRNQLIKNLKQSYSERVHQKLDNRLEINLEYKYTFNGIDEVQNYYFDEDIKNESDVGAKLAKIYNKHNRLVILGLPGSGKTSRLLDLSLKLLSQAEKNTNIAIPIIINLAPWNGQANFDEWIENIISHMLGFPKHLIKQSITSNEVVLFLDGLDEVGSNQDVDRKRQEVFDAMTGGKGAIEVMRKSYEFSNINRSKIDLQKNCIEAIRMFRDEYNIESFILCSRVYEYESAISQNIDWPYELDAQILVKPISKEKVTSVLEESKRASKNRVEARKLLNFLNKNSALQQVITTPFYFNAILVILKKSRSEELFFPDNPRELKRYITKTYIHLKLSQNIKKYSADKSKKYLNWLASFLNRKGNVTFELVNFGHQYLIKPHQYGQLYNAFAVFTISIVTFVLYDGYASLAWGGIYILIGIIFKSGQSTAFDISTTDSAELNIALLRKFSTWKKILWDPVVLFFYSLVIVIFLVARLFYPISNLLILSPIPYLAAVWLKNSKDVLTDIFHFSHIHKPYERILKDTSIKAISFAPSIFGIVVFLLLFPFGNKMVEGLKIVIFFVTMGLLRASIFKFLTLNLLFKLEGSLPFPMASFFKHCTSINILEQDGGTWRFRHQILQDYFYEEYLKNLEKSEGLDSVNPM